MAAAAAASSSLHHHHPHQPHDVSAVNLTVSVPFATITYDDTGVNVTYSILCHDSHNGIKWMVRRRYNDFKVLHSHVGRHVPESADIFPSSGGFFRARTNSSRESIEKRRAATHKYMTAMVSSLLGSTNAKQQRLCQPLIIKLLQFLEYPEWEEDAHTTATATNSMSSATADNGTMAQFWRSSDANDDARSEASAATNASQAASFFAVSSFVEEAFNAQAPDLDIASNRSGSSGATGPGGIPLSQGSSLGGAGSSAASTVSRASSNAEDAGAMPSLTMVTTYWAAPDAVKSSKIAIEIPDVACAPTVDGEFAVTVKHHIRAPRGDVRRKYDEMLYVISRVFSTDTVPTPTLMREIILQFRRQNPKRQYARNVSERPGSGANSTLRKEAMEEHNAAVAGVEDMHADPHNTTTGGQIMSDGLVMADTMHDATDGTGSGGTGGVSYGTGPRGGSAVPIPIIGALGRGLVDDTSGPQFSSPPARGALADGRVSQLPSTFGGGATPHAIRICRTVPRVSNSSHFVVNDARQTVPFRECKCTELAFCSSGRQDVLQTPSGFSIFVEPTQTANFGTSG